MSWSPPPPKRTRLDEAETGPYTRGEQSLDCADDVDTAAAAAADSDEAAAAAAAAAADSENQAPTDEEENDASFFLPRRKAGELGALQRKRAALAGNALPPPLSADFKVHMSGLERAVAAAAAKAKTGGTSPRRAAVSGGRYNDAIPPPAPLGADLKVHKCGLELAKEAADAAKAAAAGQAGPSATVPATRSPSQPLGADVKVHMSGLERARANALAAAAADGEVPRRAARAAAAGAGGGGSRFGADLLVHKSGLERAKEAATAAARETPAALASRASRSAQREAGDWQAWDG
jgi:hypothetical protein